MKEAVSAILLLAAVLLVTNAHAYTGGVVVSSPRSCGVSVSISARPKRRTVRVSLSNNNNDQDDDDDEEEIYTPTNRSEESDNNVFLDDLTPPPVNFARNSILFSENPSTKKRNNAPLEAWKFTKTYSPAFVNGAWPWKDILSMDERPLAALYNVVFVRLPVVGVAVSYLYQKIALKHDLVMDFGGGPRAIPPVLVVGILVLILL